MPQLNEIVQKILLDGDLEVINKLGEIGEQGSEAFKQLQEASEKGAGQLTVFTTGIALATAAVAGLAGALVGWVEVNTEAIQKTNFLAEAFGTTTENINAVEAAFAQAGVSTAQFEQFAQRLTVTIAREWPQIAENIRTASTEQEQAQERVRASIIRVQEAQQNLETVSERSSSQVTNAAIREQEAYLKLGRAAEEAYNTIVNDINSVQGANLSLEAAEQRLATLQGRPPSAADKQALEVKQAQLAVDKARQAATEALQKQEQDRAEAALKQQKLEQEAADAALKHETAVNEAAVARQKAELAVKEAITAREEAEERATQVALKNIPKITEALKSISEGNKDVTKSFDLGEVSVRNMVSSIINLAAAGGKLPPTGLAVMTTLMKVLAADTNHQIDAQQRLAIVQQLSQRGFASTSSAAFELLGALERGPESLDKFKEAMKGFDFTNDTTKTHVQEFRDALVLLGNAVDNINRELSAAAVPVFTEALKAITESLKSSDGLLHQFIEGIKGVGVVVGIVINEFHRLLDAIDETFHAKSGTAMKTFIEGLIVLVGFFASAWLAVPATIATVLLVIGYIRDHLDVIKQKVEENYGKFGAWVAIITAVVGLIAPIPTLIGFIIAAVVLVYENWDKVKKALIDGPYEAVAAYFKSWYDWADKIYQKIKSWFTSTPKSDGVGDAAAQAVGRAAGAEGNPDGVHLAGGGHVRGPGSSTSDSIPAMLSDGEYVVKASAVQKFGVGFMHAINNMMLPGFASGGLVGVPVRSGTPSNMQASRPLNLSIDGRTFNGLRGPKNVVDDLASYAVARQTASAGNKPSWVK